MARALQERYLRGDPRALTLLYSELRRMAAIILQGMKVSSDCIDQFSHDASSKVCEKYLKSPGWHIESSFRQYMIRACESAAQERELNPSGGHKERPITQARATQISIEINGNLHGDVKIADSLVATMPFTTYLYQDDGKIDDPYLIGILKGFFVKFKRYSLAVKQLDEFVPRKFLFDHARQLHDLWLETRNGNGHA